MMPCLKRVHNLKKKMQKKHHQIATRKYVLLEMRKDSCSSPAEYKRTTLSSASLSRQQFKNALPLKMENVLLDRIDALILSSKVIRMSCEPLKGQIILRLFLAYFNCIGLQCKCP